MNDQDAGDLMIRLIARGGTPDEWVPVLTQAAKNVTHRMMPDQQPTLAQLSAARRMVAAGRDLLRDCPASPPLIAEWIAAIDNLELIITARQVVA